MPVDSTLADPTAEPNTWKTTVLDPWVADVSGTIATLESGGAVSSHDLYFVDNAPYSAAGDGVTNDSTAIQAAIDDCETAGGGIVMLGMGKTYKANVTLGEGVILTSPAPHFGYQPTSVNMTRMIANATGTVIDTPVTQTLNCGVVGVNVGGLGSGTAAKGIRFRYVLWGIVKGVNFNNFADEGLLVDADSLACTLDGLLAVNCVLNRSRAAPTGAIDIDGTDHWLNNIESSTSSSIEGTVSSANLYCDAIVIRADNCFCVSIMGEISDIGILVTGGDNRFTNCRADVNLGHGWRVTGGNNIFTGCHGISNSQATNNTYSNFQATSASANNNFVGCSTTDAQTNKAKYGFEDLVSSDTNKNQYVGCLPTGAVTAGFFTDSAGFGSGLTFVHGPVRAFAANTTTKDVSSGWQEWYAADSVATTITDFTGGLNGQHLYILATNGNTTIQHNGTTINIPTGTNLTLQAGYTYHFYKSGVWRQVRTP